MIEQKPIQLAVLIQEDQAEEERREVRGRRPLSTGGARLSEMIVVTIAVSQYSES